MRNRNFCYEINKLFREIHAFERGKTTFSALPSRTYFMEDDRILTLERKDGVSRFPYGRDGFTLWVYSSGFISVNESTFYLILPSEEGKEPYFSVFAGEEEKNGEFSFTSVLRPGIREKNFRRYTVFGKDAAYFLLETRRNRFAIRLFVDEKKRVVLSLYAKRYRSGEGRIYLSTYINGLFKFSNGESAETKWFKKVSYRDGVFFFDSPEDIDREHHVENFGIVRRRLNDAYESCYNTTSRSEYASSRERSIFASDHLVRGRFPFQKSVTHFVDTGIAGDLTTYLLDSKKAITEDYVLEYTHDRAEAEAIAGKPFEDDPESDLMKIRRTMKRKESSPEMLKFEFGAWENGTLSEKVLNPFLRYVIYQTEYCGLCKNSGSLFLGVRDVMQQIEAALMWNPKACRKKIIKVMDFISPEGIAPRQYSLPPEGNRPRMDLRLFIDQGVWIISTIYAYLSFTDDYSILDEKARYCIRRGAYGELTRKKETVLEHMKKIMAFLADSVDAKTSCLKSLYGDWNDALDGLGVSEEKGVEYGNGVSVMATLQFYKNLAEMSDILAHLGRDEDLIRAYGQLRERIGEGIRKFAIVFERGEKKILHGWGDKRRYLVGSFADCDGKSRDSLTANAFYYISGMDRLNLLDKVDTLNAYRRLDSKYGLKTFEPYFEKDAKGVGRIVNLPKGTAENSATYIHAALFGIWSLFLMDEGEKAFEQLEKVLPVRHEKISTSPFVMPNSYSYNPEEDMDGESMNDWYTGSANTLIKVLVRGLFGVEATLDGVSIRPSSYFKTETASLSLCVKGCLFRIVYRGKNHRAVRMKALGFEAKVRQGMFFTNETLRKNKEIEIVIDGEEL